MFKLPALASTNAFTYAQPVKIDCKTFKFFAAVSLLLSATVFSACGMGRKPKVTTIGEIRGEAILGPDGVKHSPARNGELVMFEGIIYQLGMWKTSTGRHYGFVIQNSEEQSDRNPNTSDGLFIYCGNALSLSHGKSDYTPKIGDHVILNGTIKNRYGQTEVSKPELIKKIKSGLNIDQLLPPVELNPPDDANEAKLFYERLENMRCTLPAKSLVIERRRVNGRNSDSDIIAMRADHPVAQRSEALQRRIFRDPHPFDDQPDVAHDNDNGFKVSIGCQALMYQKNDHHYTLPPARTFDTINESITGGLVFVYGNYTLMADAEFTLTPGANPQDLSPPAKPADEKTFSIATYNVENLYDARNDPFDGCDYPGDVGCQGVTGNIDYAPTNAASYEARIEVMAEQIISYMHSPDIIMVQEAEDQDICTIIDGVLTETKANHADSQPDTLQQLTLQIAAKGGPEYQAVNDRDGADQRGIITAFLYRTDRVVLVPATDQHPVMGNNPTIDFPFDSVSSVKDIQNPKAFNAFYNGALDRDDILDVTFSRAVQVGHFHIYRNKAGQGTPAEIYLLNNHFSSRPNARIERRRHQAMYNAAVASTIQKARPDALVMVGGDLNVFPRPDDPIAEPPSDQLGSLYDIGLWNTYDKYLSEFPQGAYTYVYAGQAGTLDHMFLNENLKGLLEDSTVLHINSDWPEEHDGDAAMGITDHDPLVTRFRFNK